jgi:hypothetical protein
MEKKVPRRSAMGVFFFAEYKSPINTNWNEELFAAEVFYEVSKGRAENGRCRADTGEKIMKTTQGTRNIKGIGSIAIVTAMLGGFLLFGGAGAAQAADRDDWGRDHGRQYSERRDHSRDRFVNREFRERENFRRDFREDRDYRGRYDRDRFERERLERDRNCNRY